MNQPSVRSVMVFFLIAGCAAVSYGAEIAATPSLREHADVMEWVTKLLILFFAADLWRNQKEQFRRIAEAEARIAHIEGICEGKERNGGC